MRIKPYKMNLMKKKSKSIAIAMLFLLASLSPAFASDPYDGAENPGCKKVTPFTERTGYCTPVVIPFPGENGQPVMVYECEEENALGLKECEFEIIW